jgi:hypothetical protein
MIDAIVALLAGGVAGWLAWRACRGIFAHDVFARTNYRGAPLPTSAGLTGSIAAVGMVGGLVVADAAGLVELGTSAWSVHIGPTLLLALGFCLLGLIDDLAGVGESGGFMTKHIFVTGGVASSLGKGLTASSLGRLLKARGLRVTMQKLDPYINVDPGTMNPFEHGEVFVTDDGGETDLDLGHYERFIDEPLTRTPTPPPARSTRRCSPPSAAATTSARPCRSSRTSPTRSSGASAPRHRRRRRGDHRGRRHRRRHRDPPVPRGDPAVPPRRRPRQRLLHPRHAGAVHRPVGRAEDQAHAALGHRAAQPRHPARHHRVPQRGAAQPRRPEAQDLQPVRRARRRRGQRGRRPQHLRDPARAARGGPRHGGVRAPALDARRARPDRVAATWSTGRGRHQAGAHRHHRQVRGLPDAYLSVVESAQARGFHHGAEGRDRVDPGRGGRGAARRRSLCATSTASSSPAGSASAASRARSPPPATPASTTSRASACAWACR